jgi:DNA polymerase alpha-associated DNA helicase A
MTKLVEVLLGISAPSEKIPLENVVFFDPTLNDSQKAAVRFALESPEVACIHGPPGIIAISRTELNLNSVSQALGRPTL